MSEPTDSPTRAALLEAAAALADRAGVGAIGLREAARVAGVTHGAPYRHFPSREALVAAVAEQGFQRLLIQCSIRQGSVGPDPRRQFRAIGVAYICFALRHPGQFRVMYSAEAARGGDTVRSAEAAVFSLALNTIVCAQREGLVVDADPQELTMVAWSSVHGFAMLTLNGLARWVGLQGEDQEALAQRFAQRVFDGLRPERHHKVVQLG